MQLVVHPVNSQWVLPVVCAWSDGSRCPCAYWWYVCGQQGPSGACRRRETPMDLRDGL